MAWRGATIAGAFLLGLASIGLMAGIATAQGADRDVCAERSGLWFGEVGCEIEAPLIDRVVVDKSERMLWAYEDGRSVRSFRVALGGAPVGNKERQGDQKTPEGVYPVIAHKPDSSFHRALRLGYPTPEQAAVAEESGIDPGGDIMIHGLPNGQGAIGRAHLLSDWTLGCIAVTNDEIEWLYRFVADGTPVEIRA